MERRCSLREDFPPSFGFELSATGSAGPGGAPHRAQGVDISTAGLGLLTNCPLSPEMVVRLALPAQGVAAAIPVFAEVEWTRPAGDAHGRVWAGLRFLA